VELLAKLRQAESNRQEMSGCNNTQKQLPAKTPEKTVHTQVRMGGKKFKPRRVDRRKSRTGVLVRESIDDSATKLNTNIR
jgi:hypothetical protein